MIRKILGVFALSAVLVAGDLKHISPVFNFGSVAMAADLTQVVNAWLKPFDRKPTPSGTDYGKYEIKYAGSENILLQGGGVQIWADGVRAKDGAILDAKYIGKPDKSPYIAPSTGCPVFVTASVDKQIAGEFQRYAAVINDSKTPVVKLEIITNEQAAVPYFECMFKTYNVSGSVVVKP